MKYKSIIIFVALLTLCGCNKVIIDSVPKDYYINIKNSNIDIYSDTKLSDIIDTNIKFNDVLLNTNSIGDKIYNLKFKINKKKYLYHIKYSVEDLTKPRILSSSDRYIPVGKDVYLCDYIMYGDNYDNEPVCRVEGEYDLNKIGNYNIKYIVSDDAGNEEYFETILHVYEPSNETKKSKKTITYFSDVVSEHKNDKTKIGIDVSRWQGDIDFKKVKEAGAEFVFIRIGVESKQGEEIGMDSKYKQNIKKAKEAGLDVGVYLYTIALNKNVARSHAEWVVKALDGEKLELPIVFDWENFNKWNEYKLSFHDINSIADTFIDTVMKSGYKGMLYSSKFYLENIWENKNDYPVWLAHYTDETNYTGKYKIWQMCNDGVIDGINGDVDIDIMYLD